MKNIKHNATALILSCFFLLPTLLTAQFTFVHITDLHVCDNTFLGNTGNYDMNGDNFQCTLDHINSLNPKPAFVVASGDLSNVGMIGSNGMYPAITQHLFPQSVPNPAPGAYYIDAARTIPIYFIVGNHEYYQTIVPPVIKDSPQFYAEHLVPIGFGILIGNTPFVEHAGLHVSFLTKWN